MYGIFTYIYHILPLKTTIHVGKYTSPMDGLGHCLMNYAYPVWFQFWSPAFWVIMSPAHAVAFFAIDNVRNERRY